jgi:hypothetical protein
MAGPIILIVVMVLFVPLLLGGLGVLAAALGWSLTDDAKQRYAGSELIALEHPATTTDAT